MSSDAKPWWHDMFEEQKEKARQHTLKLMKRSESYRRPPPDPDIYWTGKGNKIAMVDRRTGDYLLAYGSDVENHKLSLVFFTKDDTLVRGFNTQWGGGYYGLQWDSFPIRVYGIVESNQQTEEVRTAGKRLTLERFAQFMAAFPDFADHPERDFTIFVAPRDPDERLDK